MNAHAMEFQETSILFKGEKILGDLSYGFARQKVTGIIGPSGSGKTTLLRTLSRMNDRVADFKVRGRVLVDGQEIYGNGIDVYGLRQRVGLIFQKPCIFPQSVYKNVIFGLQRLRPELKKKFPEKVEKTLSEVFLWDEVKDRLHEPAVTLSQGQQQRLAIARTLIMEPEILLMDEPTSALDPHSAKAIERLIVSLKGRNTVVVVTHNLDQVRKIADEVVFVCGGRICETGKSGDFFENPCQEETRTYLGNHPAMKNATEPETGIF